MKQIIMLGADKRLVKKNVFNTKKTEVYQHLPYLVLVKNF